MSERRWEAFAREDPLFYICTGYGSDEETFWKSGNDSVERILREVGDRLVNRGTALEIGCGVGRIVIPMCSQFERCIGVDIAPSMIEGLEAASERFGVSGQVSTYLAGQDWQNEKVDLVYSEMVFQHIDDRSVIEDYISRAAQCIGSDGVACLQFDTRPVTPSYRVRNLLPDAMLSREWRKGIRRIRRSAAYLEGEFSRQGLAVVSQSRAGTEFHNYVLVHSSRVR